MKHIFLAFLFVLTTQSTLFSQELPKFKSDTVKTDTTIINQIFNLFAEEESDKIPEAQRSKRKQVDALLKVMMEQPGKLQFSGVATAVLQTGIKSDNIYKGVGSFDIFAFTSFGKHTLLFFDFEAGGGEGPDLLIPNLSVLNANAGSTSVGNAYDYFSVSEAWTEFKALRDIFSVTFGKIDLTNYFDNNLHANDETSQFLTGVFVNNPVLPVYFNSPGIRFRTTFLGKFYIQYGLAVADTSQINLMMDHFKILETGFRLFPETGWEANFRIFGFEHPVTDNAQGFGMSFDQLIANHFNVFGRYGKNKPELAKWHGIEKVWSAGIGFQQKLFHREYKVGIAFAKTFQFEEKIAERAAELYFSTQLNKWVYVSPHLQWLQKNNPALKEHFFVGLRLSFNY